MTNENEKEKKEKEGQEEGALQSDPETLNTTDPQEHMKGPISSLMKEVGESFDDKEAEKKTGKK